MAAFLSGTGDPPEHARKHELVQRPHGIPISQPPESKRIKGGRLAQLGFVPIRLHLEFQPGPPGQFHVGCQSHAHPMV
jgi:hypothetical protein